jgi:hypothetical protein
MTMNESAELGAPGRSRDFYRKDFLEDFRAVIHDGLAQMVRFDVQEIGRILFYGLLKRLGAHWEAVRALSDIDKVCTTSLGTPGGTRTQSTLHDIVKAVSQLIGSVF